MMKLLAPVNSLDSCKMQLESGAEELYVGLRADYSKKFSFSARFQIDDNGTIMQPTKAELKEIIKYANSKNVSVNLTANAQFFSDFMQKNIDLQKAYIDYVLDGIDCGVSGVIVTDIGLLYVLQSLNLPVGIHSSTAIDTMSISQIKFLKGLGVTRAILSYQISFEEIKEIMKSKLMEIEVFGYGGCSFSGNCNLGHGLSMGIPCKNRYNIDNMERPSCFLDLTKGCGICSIWDLNEMGVDSLKIVGREFSYKQISPITELFSQALKLARKTSKNEYNENIEKIIPLWWEKAVCSKNQCKYCNMADEFYI